MPQTFDYKTINLPAGKTGKKRKYFKETITIEVWCNREYKDAPVSNQFSITLNSMRITDEMLSIILSSVDGLLNTKEPT